jgi:hypothetical protein
MPHDPLDAANAAVARYYARQQEGLLPPCDPHPGYATFQEAFIAHRTWLREQFPQHHSDPAPTPAAPPNPPAAE